MRLNLKEIKKAHKPINDDYLMMEEIFSELKKHLFTVIDSRTIDKLKRIMIDVFRRHYCYYINESSFDLIINENYGITISPKDDRFRIMVENYNLIKSLE